MSILTEEEIDTCDGHLELIKAILAKMQLNHGAVMERIKSQDEKIKFYYDVIPFLGNIIFKWFFSDKANELEKESSRMSSLLKKLNRIYLAYSQAIEKIKFGGSSVTIEDVAELFQIKMNIQKRAGVIINEPSEKDLTDFIELLERPSYQSNWGGINK